MAMVGTIVRSVAFVIILLSPLDGISATIATLAIVDSIVMLKILES